MTDPNTLNIADGIGNNVNIISCVSVNSDVTFIVVDKEEEEEEASKNSWFDDVDEEEGILPSSKYE